MGFKIFSDSKEVAKLNAVESFLNVLLIFLLLSSVFNYLAFVRARKAAQKAKEDNAALKIEVKEEIEMVTDNICGRTLPSKEAYIIAKDDKKHYFCSWDCREKFIAGN